VHQRVGSAGDLDRDAQLSREWRAVVERVLAHVDRADFCPPPLNDLAVLIDLLVTDSELRLFLEVEPCFDHVVVRGGRVLPLSAR
jgi:hypothetical protein